MKLEPPPWASHHTAPHTTPSPSPRSLAYGSLSAAQFLYKYGWLVGGDTIATSVTSPHDELVVVPRSLWPALTEPQRTVLARYQLTPSKLGLDSMAPSESPFRLPVAQAVAGKSTPLMRQVALIACCEDASALEGIAKTGKMGDEHGVSTAQIGARCAAWVHEQAMRLCEQPAVAESTYCRLALRLRRGERERLIEWLGGLSSKFEPAKQLMAEAEEAHKAAAKASKTAFKKALKRTAAGNAAPVDVE